MAALLIGLLSGAFSITPLGHALEQKLGLWLLFRLRGAVGPPPEVVIIAMRRDSGERIFTLRDPPRDDPCADLRIDHRAPTHEPLGSVPERWGRCHYVELLRRLTLAKPGVVVLDVCVAAKSELRHSRLGGYSGQLLSPVRLVRDDLCLGSALGP